MTPLAATATHPYPVPALLLLVLAVWVAGYLAVCWLYPFTPCRRCTGTGRRRALTGRGFRLCRHCDGNGRHLRPGRRLINSVRELHDRADR